MQNMTTEPPNDPGPATDRHDALRQRVQALQETSGTPLTDLARDAGISYGTFYGWLRGSYRGDNERIADQVERWLAGRAEQQRTASILPDEPGYQPTRTAEQILSILRFAQAAPDFCVVAGGPGIGKTTAAREYQRQNPNVWMLTAEPAIGRVHGMLLSLCDEMGISERNSTRLSAAIARKARGSRGLILVDEAQHLETRALDQLRAFHDLAGVGVAALGNETVYARLEGEGRKPAFAQLFSRVGMRLSRPRPLKADIETMLAAWQVSDAKEAALLRAIAGKPGGLRGLSKTLRVASMFAAGAGVPRGAEHVRAAWTQLSGAEVAE